MSCATGKWERIKGDCVSQLQRKLDQYCISSVRSESSSCSGVSYARLSSSGGGGDQTLRCYTSTNTASRTTSCYNNDRNAVVQCDEGTGNMCTRHQQLNAVINAFGRSHASEGGFTLQEKLDSYCMYFVRQEHNDCIAVSYARLDGSNWRCFASLSTAQSAVCVDDTGAATNCKRGNRAKRYCTRNSQLRAVIDTYGSSSGSSDSSCPSDGSASNQVEGSVANTTKSVVDPERVSVLKQVNAWVIAVGAGAAVVVLVVVVGIVVFRDRLKNAVTMRKSSTRLPEDPHDAHA
eukprot:TRINITY_DN36475_c0_g1_i1.p1 TRINITY_DN36475_c0_g1~~TRINITY_DN36475_c0_g1_i1.p1  ORF type:complete len:291 (+),score=12.73 TRINITY_DN36475_c0_g1_i1:423-1295(+)